MKKLNVGCGKDIKKDYINIDVNGEAKITITTLAGQNTYITEVNNKNTLNISQLKPGIYIVKIKQPESFSTEKLIITE